MTIFLLIVVALVCLWQRCFNIRKDAALFSWDSSVLQKEESEQLFQIMKEQKLTILFQYITNDMEVKSVQDFLIDARENQVEVWLLTGAPDWGLDANGTCMITEVNRAIQYNKGLARECWLQGIVMDCEPYLTEEWEEDPDGVMDTLCLAMKKSKQAANVADIKFMACIPYYLDTKGFQVQLTDLICEGCDAVAIMNYYKEDEVLHIQDEVLAARKAKKPVFVIYELQQPGKHGLSEINTYYHDGMTAVQNSWKMIVDIVGERGIMPAFHEYNALQEVILNE